MHVYAMIIAYISYFYDVNNSNNYKSLEYFIKSVKYLSHCGKILANRKT